MSDLVKYHNDFNSISLKGFKEKELDLLFSICYKFKDQASNKLTLTFSELKSLSQYCNRNLDRFIKDLDGVYKKLIELNFKIEDENNIIRFVLFTKYNIKKDKKEVTIQVNEDFKYILNELTGNYTKFELIQFTSLNSSYSKNIFKLLKQFNSTGWREFFYDEFKELLVIPKSYKACDIDKQILKPSIEELKQYFFNIRFVKIKSGRKIYKIRFEWDLDKLFLDKNKKKEIFNKSHKELLADKHIEEMEKAKLNSVEANLRFQMIQELLMKKVMNSLKIEDIEGANFILRSKKLKEIEYEKNEEEIILKIDI